MVYCILRILNVILLEKDLMIPEMINNFLKKLKSGKKKLEEAK